MKQDAKTKNQILESLQDSISYSGEKTLPETIQQETEVIADPVEEIADPGTDHVSEVIENIPVQEIQQTSEVISEVKEKVQPSISLFSDIAQQTEEDKQSLREEKTETILENFTGKNDPEDSDLEDMEDSPAVRKELASVKAGAIVEIIDVIGMLLCMFVAKNWTQSAQDRYSISEKRKNAMKVLIMKMYMASKKKTSPVSSLILLGLGSIIPMVILAIMERRSRNKAETEVREKDNLIIQWQNESAQLREMIAMKDREIEAMRNQTIHVTESKFKSKRIQSEAIPVESTNTKPVKGKQGRHKKWCNYYNGLECNCKN